MRARRHALHYRYGKGRHGGHGWLKDTALKAAKGAVALGAAGAKRGITAAGGLAQRGGVAIGRGARTAVTEGGKALADVGRDVAEHMQEKERTRAQTPLAEDEEYVLVRRRRA